MVVEVVSEPAISTECDPCLYDIQALNERFENESRRVFVPEDGIYLQILEPGQRPKYVDNTIDLKALLDPSRGFEGLRIINIQQQTSVGPLVISKSAAQVLVNELSIFPAFLELINAFGEKDAHAPRSLSPIFERKDLSDVFDECCYLLKHVEKHEREGGNHDWSIRQTGVYVQLDSLKRQTTVVLLKPLRRSARRYFDLSKKHSLNGADVETLIFSTSLSNWNGYMDDLEREINGKVDSAFATLHTEQGSLQNHRGEVESRPLDLHRLVFLGQRLESVYCALRLNEDVLQRRRPSLGQDKDQRGTTLHTLVKNLLSRSESLRDRVALALDLTKGTLDIRTSQRSMEIAALARKDSVSTLELSKRAVDDSRSLKTISVLTLFYLPASFVATLLGMGYVHVVRSRSVTLVIDGEFFMFIILTVILMLITVAVWTCYTICQRRRERLIHVQSSVLV